MPKIESVIEVRQERRLCTVNERIGYFHMWEQWSEPVGPSVVAGGHPAGAVSHISGIVEFPTGVERVYPRDIKFCDEKNHFLCQLQKRMDKTGEIPVV